MRGLIQKRFQPGDESEFNAIDIEFFVVKKVIQPQDKTHYEIVCQSRTSASPIVLVVVVVLVIGWGVEVVAKAWMDGRRQTTIGPTS